MVGDRMTSGIPFRDTFWNVPEWGRVALYVGGLIAVAIFAYGTWQRIQHIRQGGPEARFDRIPERLQLVVKHVLGQARVLAQEPAGLAAPEISLAQRLAGRSQPAAQRLDGKTRRCRFAH